MKKEDIEGFLTTWAVILVLNQLFIFGACFAPYCIIAALPHTGIIAFFITLHYLKKSKDEEKPKSKNVIDTVADEVSEALNDASEHLEDIIKEHERKDEDIKTKRKVAKFSKLKPKSQFNEDLNVKKEIDPLKEKGDRYEKFIGKKFEDKGELVIYNGFIYGYEDKGVDIISISLQTKSINLIQCKNWTKKPMMLDDVENVYKKLDKYSIANITQDFNQISKHLQIKKSPQEVRLLLSDIDIDNYTVRKTLYAGSDKVIDLNIGKHLKLIQKNIFRYKDMKIVIISE